MSCNVDCYNLIQLHQKLGMRTPTEAEDDFFKKSEANPEFRWRDLIQALKAENE